MSNNSGVSLYLVLYLMSLITLGISAFSDFSEKKFSKGILRILLLCILITSVIFYVVLEKDSPLAIWSAAVATLLMFISNLFFAMEIAVEEEGKMAGKLIGGVSAVGIIIFIVMALIILT
jgi:hypothetical protein